MVDHYISCTSWITVRGISLLFSNCTDMMLAVSRAYCKYNVWMKELRGMSSEVDSGYERVRNASTG